MSKIILLTGWASPKESLQSLTEELALFSDVTAVSIHDLLSFDKGDRPVSGLPVLSDYARGLVKLIDDTGDNCFLIGWSTGGLVAMEAAVHCRNMVDGMVLVNTTSRFCSGTDYDYGASASTLRAMIQGMQKDPERTLINFHKKAHKPFIEETASVEVEMKASCLIGNKDLITGLHYLQEIDIRDSLLRIDIPSVVIHGKEDAIIPWEAGRFLADGIRNSLFRLHADAGHDLPARYPELIVDEVKKTFKNS